MPDKYDIDYSQQTVELLPPDKRYATITGYLIACFKSTVQFLRDAVLGDYRNGSVAGDWAAGTYARGDKVNYKKGIYVSLVDSNISLPTDTDYWYFQQQFFIGLDERLVYNGQTLVLTYALNKWFGTTFRQPGAGLSDIYITTNEITPNTFQVGYSSFECSTIGYDSSSEPLSYVSNFGVQYNANIYVPSTLMTLLGSAATALIESFVNKYIYAGIVYEIITY